LGFLIGGVLGILTLFLVMRVFILHVYRSCFAISGCALAPAANQPLFKQFLAN